MKLQLTASRLKNIENLLCFWKLISCLCILYYQVCVFVCVYAMLKLICRFYYCQSAYLDSYNLAKKIISWTKLIKRHFYKIIFSIKKMSSRQINFCWGAKSLEGRGRKLQSISKQSKTFPWPIWNIKATMLIDRQTDKHYLNI